MKIWLLAGMVMCSCVGATAQGFQIQTDQTKKHAEVSYNGKLVTAYCFYDSIMKPILFPINTLDGITVTRGYPIAPRAGERTDHPHHAGFWMNYESVNGLDFWNNSTAIPVEWRDRYGTIRHQEILSTTAQSDHASLTATAEWKRPDDVVLLRENTTFIFRVKNDQLLIDRITTLTADSLEVVFKDVKDGLLGIRVARELEMPSKENSKFVDAQGNETQVPASAEDVTGVYLNSDGVAGDSVWSTKGKWAVLKGRKGGKNIAIGIIDHPSNTGYPTYWHARGYGLFAANPLGRKVFSKGKEELNLRIQPKEKVRFMYRLVVQSGSEISAAVMDRLADEFSKLKSETATF